MCSHICKLNNKINNGLPMKCFSARRSLIIPSEMEVAPPEAISRDGLYHTIYFFSDCIFSKSSAKQSAFSSHPDWTEGQSMRLDKIGLEHNVPDCAHRHEHCLEIFLVKAHHCQQRPLCDINTLHTPGSETFILKFGERSFG